MRYRSESDIVAQLLLAATGGSTKTKLMYKSYLSFMQLKEYLKLLTQNGLIDCEHNGRIYRTTDKGYRFLQLYDQIGEFLPPVEIRKSSTENRQTIARRRIVLRPSNEAF